MLIAHCIDYHVLSKAVYEISFSLSVNKTSFSYMWSNKDEKVRVLGCLF